MSQELKEINVKQLFELINDSKDIQLIDVREPDEYEIANLRGELIPMNTIPDNIDKIDRDKTVIIHCRSGIRSANIIQYLQSEHSFKNLFNLKGGILAWSDEIDSSIQKY